MRPWSGFVASVNGALSAQAATKGAGLRILTETVNSPTLAAQIQQVIAEHPEAKWVQWDPTPRDNVRAGARLAFGEFVEPVYDLEKADVIVSLDADFLAAENAFGVKYARAFASRRRVDTDPDRLSRLYVIEATPSVTGGRADHRLPLQASQIDAFARAVGAAVGVAGVTGAAPAGSEAPGRRHRQGTDRAPRHVAGRRRRMRSRPPSTPWRTPSTTCSATPARP